MALVARSSSVRAAVHYVHPDKGPDLWINEVGVAPSDQGRGIGRQVMERSSPRRALAAVRRGWEQKRELSARKLYESSGGVETKTASSPNLSI